MIAIRTKGNIFLCDMEPGECGFGALEELAAVCKIRVLYMMGAGVILQMDWDELKFLMAVMVHIAGEEMRSYNSRIIHEILGMLTCVMEQAIESPSET